MFFRRERPKNPTFSERLDQLRQAGFSVTPLPAGGVRVSRADCAVDLKEEADSVRAIAGRAGILMGERDRGPGGWRLSEVLPDAFGKKKPATADELKALHDFEEDLQEASGRRACTTNRWARFPPSICTTA